MIKKIWILLLFPFVSSATSPPVYDVCVYGGTSGDSAHVIRTGTWQLQKGDHYGPSAFTNAQGTVVADAVVFVPVTAKK